MESWSDVTNFSSFPIPSNRQNRFRGFVANEVRSVGIREGCNGFERIEHRNKVKQSPFDSVHNTMWQCEHHTHVACRTSRLSGIALCMLLMKLNCVPLSPSSSTIMLIPLFRPEEWPHDITYGWDAYDRFVTFSKTNGAKTRPLIAIEKPSMKAGLLLVGLVAWGANVVFAGGCSPDMLFQAVFRGELSAKR